MTVVVLSLLMTGCSNTQDEEAIKEELKAEIQQEMAEEAAKEEASKEEVKDQVVPVSENLGTNEYIGDNRYLLRGRLEPNVPPFGSSMVLETPITITRVDGEKHELKMIMLSDDTVYNYVERDEFKYEAPFLTIRPDSVIPLEIIGDFSSFIAFDDMFGDDFWKIDEMEIVSVNNDKTLIDHSNEYYPREVSEAIFYSYCYNEFDGRPKDVKEGYYYVNTDTGIGMLYKNAVDMLLESGLSFNQGEGDYYISEEKTVYLDGEVQQELNYKLSVSDFVDAYPPTRVEMGEVADYGFRNTTLYFEDATLLVTVRHQSDDYLDGVISSIVLTGNTSYSIDGLYVGMSLPEAYRQAEDKYERYAIGDPDAMGDAIVYQPAETRFALSFNNGRYESNNGFDVEKQVVNISLINYIE